MNQETADNVQTFLTLLCILIGVPLIMYRMQPTDADSVVIHLALSVGYVFVLVGADAYIFGVSHGWYR